MLKIKDMNLNNVIRQGDTQPRQYQLDTGNLNLNLTNKSATIRLMTADFQGIGYETTATVSSENKISFSIDDVIPARQYRLEVTVDDYVFPSRATDGQFNIDPSSHGQEVNIIQIIGKDEIVRDVKEQVEDGLQPFLGEISQAELDRQAQEEARETAEGERQEEYQKYGQQFTDVITELSEEKDYHSLPEIAGARGGFDTLGERLNDTTAQLAQKVDEVILDESTIKFYADGVIVRSFSLAEAGNASVVQDYIDELVSGGQIESLRIGERSVAPENTTFLRASNNLFNKNDVVVGNLDSITGELVDAPSFRVSGFISVEPGMNIVKNGVNRYFLYKQDKSYLQPYTINSDEPYTIPPTIYYIRARVHEDDLDTAQINIGEELLPYDEYGYDLINTREKPIRIKLSPETVGSEELKEKSVGNRELKPNSVQPENTTFFKYSTNLFNAGNVSPHILSNSDGSLVDSSTYSTDDYTSVELNTAYTFRHVFRLAFYDERHQFISSKNFLEPEQAETVVTPENAVYIRASIVNEHANTTQINKGTSLLPYEPYYEKLNVEVDFTANNRNLFTGFEDDLVTSTNSNTGETYIVKTSTSNVYSVLVPIEIGATYNINKKVGGNRFIVAFLKDNPKESNELALYLYQGSRLGIEQSHQVTNDVGARYLFILTNFVSDDKPEMEIKDNMVYFDKLKLPDKSVGVENVKDDLKKLLPDTNRFYPPADFMGAWTSSSSDYSLEESTNLQDIHYLYQSYDELITKYPNVLTKQVFGLDESSQYEIWGMELKAPKLDKSRVEDKKPKILLLNGTHGNEYMANITMYYFIKEILENWRSSDFLSYLRWNVDIAFMPIIDPYSSVSGIYAQNVNGVSISRNLPVDWRPATSDLVRSFGEEPLDQIESHYLKSFIDTHSDAIFCLDIHASGFGNGHDDLMYHSFSHVYNRNYDVASNYHIKTMTQEFIKNYDLDEDGGYIGWLSASTPSGTIKAYGESLGIPVAVYETFYALPDRERYDTDSTKASVECFLNWVVFVINQFSK